MGHLASFHEHQSTMLLAATDQEIMPQ